MSVPFDPANFLDVVLHDLNRLNEVLVHIRKSSTQWAVSTRDLVTDAEDLFEVLSGLQDRSPIVIMVSPHDEPALQETQQALTKLVDALPSFTQIKDSDDRSSSKFSFRLKLYWHRTALALGLQQIQAVILELSRHLYTWPAILRLEFAEGRRAILEQGTETHAQVLKLRAMIEQLTLGVRDLKSAEGQSADLPSDSKTYIRYKIRKLEMQFGQVQVSHAAKEAFRNQDYKPWHASRISSNTHSQDVLDLAIDSLCAACETLLDPAATIQYAFEVLASCTTALAEACLFDEAATLAEHVTCIVRLVATDTESVAARTWLVRWLNSLSSALARVGQPERALLVAIEAVELARALADQSPPLQAELSRSLFLLSSRYSVLRRTTEGICAIEEAVRIDRLLAEQHGDEAHQASLAVSLVLLSYCQRVVSQPEAALESSTQAIQIFRKLYDHSPDLYCADLATCLTSNANRQAALGHAEAAFSTCSEAVQLLRDLYSRRPEHYRHALAECLNSLSYRQLSRGRFTESLASAAEAVQLKQVVYVDNPRLAAEYLAHGLDTLSDMQAAAGGLDQEALATLEEAIGMQRKLFQERPSMQGGSLAVMLFNASLRHAKLGHASESQAFRTECQAICKGSDVVRKKVVRNLRSGIQLQLKLGRSDGVDLRRSLLASLEAQADVDDL